MTLQQASDRFLSQGQVYWSPRTLIYYRRNLGYFVQYAETITQTRADELPLSALPEDIFVRYVVWLRSKSRYDTHPLYASMQVSGTIKSNTVNSYARAVRSFLNYLARHDYLSGRFTRQVRLPRGDRDQILPLLAFEVEQIDRMFDHGSPDGLRNLCILHLMLDAGLRSSEVIRLRTKDLLFPSGAIAINRSKGNKSRMVLLCPSLARLLQAYQNQCHPAASGLFFSRRGGSAGITYSVLRSLFLRIRRNTGLERIHPHLLRHTFATSYIMGGGNLETLRILLGHSDYTVTRTYLHLAAQYQILKSPIYRLDPVFFEKGY